jgi:hypothetical protein
MPKPTETSTSHSTLPVFSFGEIEMSGAYLEMETGRLFRVQPTALQPGHSPLISITCTESWRYVRLSEDPNIPIGKARVIAADNDMAVCF